MKSILTIIFFLAAFSLFGQIGSTINLEEPYLGNLDKNKIDLVDETYIYVNDGESKELFYYALKPQKKIKGTLILLPPTAQPTEGVLNENNSLIKLAYENGILVLVPSINYNLCLDEVAMKFLNTTFQQAIKKYKAPLDKIVIGGFSLGGMNAIRYVQLSNENAELTTIKPVAVYGVDPPLDWARIYYSFLQTKELNFSEVAVNEATNYLAKLEQGFGGSPKEVPEMYVKHSMYSKTEKKGGNAIYLKNTPIRIYADVDINWHLKERHTDLYNINALDQTAMINQLKIAGNQDAEFINALGKGYRANGVRHPHSWSIVDPVELMDWMKIQLKD
jgi:hypothetical protein